MVMVHFPEAHSSVQQRATEESVQPEVLNNYRDSLGLKRRRSIRRGSENNAEVEIPSEAAEVQDSASH